MIIISKNDSAYHRRNLYTKSGDVLCINGKPDRNPALCRKIQYPMKNQFENTS